MVIAYQHIRDRYNQLRADHKRLKKILNTQAFCNRQPVSSGVGICLSHCGEQSAKSLYSTSSGIASVPFSNQPSASETHDVERKRECAQNDVLGGEILSICQKLECLAASRVEVSDSLLLIAVQLRNVASRVSQTTELPVVIESRTGRNSSVICSTDLPGLQLVSSANEVSDVVKQVDGSPTQSTTIVSINKEELASNGCVDVMNLDDLDDDFLFGE